MLSALQHATLEARSAAAHASGYRSKARVAVDFIASRLLKHFRLPGYNAPRLVQLDDLSVTYRFNRGDLQSMKEVFLDCAYEIELPFRPQTILDLGANIGLTSLWLWQKYKPERIIAVEPDPANTEIAIRNLTQNGVRGKVLRAAVGAGSGTAWLAQRSESNLGTIISVSSVDSESAIEVPVLGISELISRFGNAGVDLVKMDIEGSEAELFGGETAWLQQVRSLVVEFHDDRVESAPLIRRVQAAGFAHLRVNETRQDNLSLFVRKCAA